MRSRPWNRPSKRPKRPSRSVPSWFPTRWPSPKKRRKRCSSSAWRTFTTCTICCTTCRPGFTTAARRKAKKSRDNTGAGTAQPQDDTHTNEILHRALGNLGAVVQAHQPQQAVGPATPACSFPSPHAARTGGPYAWGRDARRKIQPCHPTRLPVCSSARRRHSLRLSLSPTKERP